MALPLTLSRAASAYEHDPRTFQKTATTRFTKKLKNVSCE